MVLRTTIIGSGNVGCDILAKVERSPHLRCVKFVGRNPQSPGLQYAARRGVAICPDGVEELLAKPDSFDLVFDATSAAAHDAHASALQEAGKIIVNLTPAASGKWCVPAINGAEIWREGDVNMITCGGQASLPIVYAMKQAHDRIEYLEVVSSISAKSAGPATRLNLSEYLTTTEQALAFFTGCARTKVILNINPAEPSVSMQTAVSALIENADIAAIRDVVHAAVASVQRYVPGYQLVVEPYADARRVFAMIKVNGRGDYLPAYAGNLDIITCSAVRVAEIIGGSPRFS